MAQMILLHISNDDPVLVEVEDLPGPNDIWIRGVNPRRRDNKDVHYLLPEVTTVIYPMWRINFIEVMPGEDTEKIEGIVREGRARDY